MKKGIHPEYKDITVKCSCGNSFVTRSTKKAEVMSVEICAACHPFFTGSQKLMDTMGRVDKFKRKFARTAPAGKGEAGKGEAKA